MELYDDAEVFISEMCEFSGNLFFPLGYMYCKETFQNYNMIFFLGLVNLNPFALCLSLLAGSESLCYVLFICIVCCLNRVMIGMVLVRCFRCRILKIQI